MKMKKLLLFGMVLPVIFLALSACNSSSNSNPSGNSRLSDGEIATFNFQNIRSEFFSSKEEYPYQPVITIVSSRSELEQYYEKNRMVLYDGNGNVLPDKKFLDSIEQYSNNYFTNKFLVIVRLVEPSGSIGHKVEKIDKNGDIVIQRLLPEMGTSDMAAWSIVIELNNNVKAEQYQAVLVDIKNY
jgi:hypothetical protein